MAGPKTWTRIRTVTAISAASTDVPLVSIPLNDTLLRIHAGVAIIATLPGHTAFPAIESNHLVAGIYTTLTSGGTILDPSTSPGDFAPPLQRWLWWEQLYPVSQSAGDQPRPDTRQKFIYLPAQNPLDIESQVIASTAITLHMGLHSSAIPANIKDYDLWGWFSVLRSGT